MVATINIHRPPVKPKPALTYPVLAQSKTTGRVVLFTAIGRGVSLVVGKAEHGLGIGLEFNNFVDVTDGATWEILPEGTTVEIVQGGFE